MWTLLQQRKEESIYMNQTSIGKDLAIRLYNAGWWEHLDPKQIASFQLKTAELCIPFGLFQSNLE
jgi:hypothetical protein